MPRLLQRWQNLPSCVQADAGPRALRMLTSSEGLQTRLLWVSYRGKPLEDECLDKVLVQWTQRIRRFVMKGNSR